MGAHPVTPSQTAEGSVTEMKLVYKCDFCASFFGNEDEAIDHEKRCGHNPKNRINNKLVFRLSMIFHSFPKIVACALHEVAKDELDFLYAETERADSANCCFTIKENQGRILNALYSAKTVAKKHDGRNSSTYNDSIKEYKHILSKALSTSPRPMRNVNMLLHLFGYFSKELSKEEKAFFLETLEKYQNKKVPFSLPLTIIKSWAIRFNNEYLLEQKIFESFPIELIEVTDSGKGI